MLQPFYSTLRRQKGIVGELRPLSDDPASFESGSDLLTLNGRPWSRSHFTLSQKNLILTEGLGGTICSGRLGLGRSFIDFTSWNRRSQILYTLNDTYRRL